MNECGEIVVIFTKSLWSPLSWLVRWVLPRSRFSLALSSHCYVQANNQLYEAILFHGVRKVTKEDSIDKDIVVKKISYSVPHYDKSVEFLEAQLGKKYDLKGVLGVGINPDRDWEDDNQWYCYELAASALKAGGRNDFNNISYITETSLMAVNGTAVY